MKIDSNKRNTKMRKLYKARSLKNAEATVRNLRKQVGECHALLEKWYIERKTLAMLAADTPQFFNPIVAMEAKRLRNSILSGH